MFLRQRTRGGRQRRGGLGTVSTQVGNSLVYSSSPVAPQSNLRRPILGVRIIGPVPVQSTPPRPVGVVGIVQPINQLWGGNPPRSIWGAGGSGYGTSPTSTSLATAQALLNSNPSLLTQAQWTMLQQAGLVASTVPYSSASQVGSGSSAIDPTTGQTYASELAAAQAAAAGTTATTTSSTDIGTMLDTPYAGLPLYLWLAIGGVGLYMFSGKRGR